MRLLSFDVETTIDGNIEDLDSLHISCWGLANRKMVIVEPMDDPVMLLNRMIRAVEGGYKIVTWNGLAFDFRLLYNALPHKHRLACINLALNHHIDLMFMVVCYAGHRLGLDTACKGMGVGTKLHEVTLRDGTKITDMSGARAPALWDQDERQAVLEYLARDVEVQRDLAHAIRKEERLRWTSKRGKEQAITMPSLLTVAECSELPACDTSWMKDPPKRADFFTWIPVPMCVCGSTLEVSCVYINGACYDAYACLTCAVERPQ